MVHKKSKKDEKIILIDDEIWKQAVKNLVLRGELTVEEANLIYKRLEDRGIEV